MPYAKVVVHEAQVEALKRHPELPAHLRDITSPLVAKARSAAPKRTGAGAASIHAELVLDGDEWTALVGWDREHYYMRFHELGTRTLPARPFLVPAVKGARR